MWERVTIIVISQKAVAVAVTAVASLLSIFRCAGPAEHKADLEVDGWAVKSSKVGPETSVGLNIELVCCQRPLNLLRFFLGGLDWYIDHSMVRILKQMWKTSNKKKPMWSVTHLGDRLSLQRCAAMACRRTMVRGSSSGNGSVNHRRFWNFIAIYGRVFVPSVFRCRCCPLLQRKVLSHLGILAQMAVVGGWLLGVSPSIKRQYQF